MKQQLYWEIGVPGRMLVKSEQEALELVNKNLRLTNLYTTVYKYTALNPNDSRRPDYNTAIVDKMFFDFDQKQCDCVAEALKLVESLNKNDIKHETVFSGRGVHVLPHVKLIDYKYKKEALLSSQKFLVEKLSLFADTQALGRLAQLRRLPNTFNFRAGRFCVNITDEELAKGFDFLCELAKKQRLGFKHTTGNNSLDISKFDKQLEFNGSAYENNMQEKYYAPLLEGKRKIPIPPFLMNAVDSNNWDRSKGHITRFLLILWIREHGVALEDCAKMLEKMLSAEEYKHCINEVPGKKFGQIEYVYGRSRGYNALFFPSIAYISMQGFELSDTDIEMIQELYL